MENTRWKNMMRCFFVDYNNGFEKTYQMFEIEKQEENFDWRGFINKIKAYNGCGTKELQQALQENNIYFIAYHTFSKERFDEYMTVDFNKQNSTILEHNNIGNY